MKTSFFCMILVLVGLTSPGVAQEGACGPPPSENVLKDISQKTKGDIEGKAQAITKFLGSADLGGKIETERRTLYQTTDQSEAIRNDRYLFYVTCVLLMKDSGTPLGDKLEAIRKLRQPIQSGPSKSELLKSFLAEFNSDIAPEKIREVLGNPAIRIKLPVGDGVKKRTFVLERFDSTYANIFVIGSSPVQALAIAVTATPPKGAVPIPYYGWQDDDGKSLEIGLGDFTLAKIRDACNGQLSDPDARYLYVRTPTCYLGRPGGYNYFVFKFDGDEAFKSCGIDIFNFKKMDFTKFSCSHFWTTKPDFALIYFSLASSANDPSQDAQLLTRAVLDAIYWRQ